MKKRLHVIQKRIIVIARFAVISHPVMAKSMFALQECVALYDAYFSAYEKTRENVYQSEDRPFDFSLNHIFGPFRAFCDRLKKVELHHVASSVSDSNKFQ